MVAGSKRSMSAGLFNGPGEDAGGSFSVIYNAFLRANYFFILTESGFGGGGFCKRVVGQGDVFHRDKVTSECGGGQLTQFWGYG
jgi:hypothetical protein